MKDYSVRCTDLGIEKTINAETATDAALQLAEQIQLSQDVYCLSQECLAFEVEINDIVTRVSISFEHIEDTIRFPDNTLDPVETPLALTLNRTFQPRKESTNGRSSKAFRPVR